MGNPPYTMTLTSKANVRDKFEKMLGENENCKYWNINTLQKR